MKLVASFTKKIFHQLPGFSDVILILLKLTLHMLFLFLSYHVEIKISKFMIFFFCFWSFLLKINFVKPVHFARKKRQFTIIPYATLTISHLFIFSLKTVN